MANNAQGNENNPVNAGQAFVNFNPENLAGTYGRPRRPKACEACKRRRGKVRLNSSFLSGQSSNESLSVQ